MTTESPDGEPAEPRTYAGWKVGLVVIALVAAVAYLLNVLGTRTAPTSDRRAPEVVSATPSP